MDAPDLAQLTALFDSDDVFVKYIHYTSPSSVQGDRLLWPNALGAVAIVFEGFESITRLELALTGVKHLAFDFTYEIEFNARYDAFSREYTVTLNGLGREIRCKGLSYRVQPN
ncbi:hypothetical protein [Hymenobacter arizonensis]|uniref:Uncharacterized protein n=1 Tax=Hymenobacter arizonensis TaxID=1227077 RepID=A0A1I6BSX8_HYMAR|nr:hypothetical protein [Hymenobacter arizonensis]SFQ83984.1 hypothetical protein SAMN04515668_5059 [Hymenobacter arizonensis]